MISLAPQTIACVSHQDTPQVRGQSPVLSWARRANTLAAFDERLRKDFTEKCVQTASNHSSLAHTPLPEVMRVPRVECWHTGRQS